MITARLAITGAFARGIPNYRSTPLRNPVLEPLTIYHSMPHGLVDPQRKHVEPEAYVDVTEVQGEKLDALCCHQSQKHWLDLTQGPDSYLHALDRDSRELGSRSVKFHHAEAWTRHLHLGFGALTDNPLQDALGEQYLHNQKFVL